MTVKPTHRASTAIDYYRKRVASLSCYDALDLDNGVTGTEIPSGSGDLLSLPVMDVVGGCYLIDARMKLKHKGDGVEDPCATSK